jgi:hypothetical protein
MSTSSRSSLLVRFARPHSSRLLVISAVSGCGDDGGAGGQGGAGDTGGAGGGGQSAGDVACRAACDQQREGCPTVAIEDCNDICDALVLVTDDGVCDALLADWKNCEAGLTYMCAPDGETAFPTDPGACNTEADAYLDDPDC